MISLAAPGDPGRPPDTVRHPDPAAAGMQMPAAVMEGSPTPRIVRLPEPSGIAVNPVAGIAIGPPSAVNYQDTRLPTPTDAFQLHPGAIRRKVIIEITHLRWRAADIHGRRSFRRRRRRRLGSRGWRRGFLDRRGDGDRYHRRLSRGSIKPLIIGKRLRLISQHIVAIEHRRDYLRR